MKNRLLEIRLSKGYKKQKDFAEFLNINKSKYNRYENNMEQPSLNTLFQIANKLNIDISEIVYYEKGEPTEM
ncbi:helix-turn-helix transcriptional regulator [Clostridium sp. Marseille-Q7071]